MKTRLFIPLLVIVATLFNCSVFAQKDSFKEGYKKWRESKSRVEKQKLMLDGFPSNRTINADSTHSYDAIHLDITISCGAWDPTFEATVEMKAVSTEDNLGQIDFHLDGCTINALQVDGITVNYTHDCDVVLVDLPEPYMTGDTARVRVDYTGDILEQNFDGGLIRSGGLFTLGEPYCTRKWLACYDFPFDKVTCTMTTIMHDSHEALSNGYLVEETDLGNGRKRTVWQNDDPVSTYLISMVARDYTIVDLGEYGVNDTPVKLWVYPEYETEATYDMGRTGVMIEYFEELFGPYPFNKYDQGMAYIFGGWGAMEHQSCTTMGTILVRYGDRSFERIVAHELAHQWWGDYVGPLSFKEIWLNEGFATYSEPLWQESYSMEERDETLQNLRYAYFEDDARSRFALYDPPYDLENGTDELFSTTVYDKGALVLHVLRWVLGDDAFFEGLRYYAEQHAFGSATTPEFQENMEHVSGEDLSDFFDQWVYQAGYPEYLLDDFEVISLDSFSVASLTIFQNQTDAPLFNTPVPIYFTNGVQDTLVRFDMAAEVQQRLTCGGLTFLPTSAVFDPEGWILCTADDSRTNVEERELIISEFSVSKPWPNPFNSSTSILFDIPVSGDVVIDIFDILGRRVETLVNHPVSAGTHRYTWTPGTGMSSGTYLISVTAGSRAVHKKVVLLK